jgi:hypothetical protein
LRQRLQPVQQVTFMAGDQALHHGRWAPSIFRVRSWKTALNRSRACAGQAPPVGLVLSGGGPSETESAGRSQGPLRTTGAVVAKK